MYSEHDNHKLFLSDYISWRKVNKNRLSAYALLDLVNDATYKQHSSIVVATSPFSSVEEPLYDPAVTKAVSNMTIGLVSN